MNPYGAHYLALVLVFVFSTILIGFAVVPGPVWVSAAVAIGVLAAKTADSIETLYGEHKEDSEA
jgi:hypothetical protein